MNKMIQRAGLAGVFVTALSASSALAGIVLDDFDADTNTGLAGAGTYSSVIFSNPFNQGSSFSLDTLLDSGSDIGAVIFNSGIGVEQGASISYDNGGDGLNMDFASMGVLGFEMDFLDVDQGFTMGISLGNNGDGPSGLGGVASLAVFVPAGMNQTASWTLNDFIISPGFDIQDVDSIIVDFNLEQNPTASLDFIASEFRLIVPTPGTSAILAFGGLAMTRRRRSS